MLMYLLFVVAAFGEECESSTCVTCKTNSSCNWYGFDCLSISSKAVTTLGLPATATCPTCQAGNCGECQAQDGCAWFSSVVPGVPGKCDVNTTTSTAYTLVPTCPACFNSTDCTSCVAREATEGCGWYVLPGFGGKCREASPSFAYSQVPADSCAQGNPCSGVRTCSDCQAVNNETSCSWYTSKSPSFYNSKCDSQKAGVVDSGLYTKVTGTCPLCAGISCLDCKAENGCKWAAVSSGLGTAFGECLTNAATTPSTKTVIATCPATCQLHSCQACTGVASCNWFTGSSVIDDSCDLASDAKLQHPTQTPVTSSASCGACMADRCYECNNLSGCGWYAKKLLGVTLQEGCFSKTSPPAGRELVANSNSKCDGVPSSSTHVAASMGLLLVLAFIA